MKEIKFVISRSILIYVRIPPKPLTKCLNFQEFQQAE